MLGSNRVDEFVQQAGFEYTLGIIGREGQSIMCIEQASIVCVRRYMI